MTHRTNPVPHGETIAQRLGLTEVELYRKLLETAPDAMVICDSTGCIVFANAQTERMFGYPSASLLGRPVEILVPERLRASHREHRRTYARTPTARPMGLDMALIAVREDGTELPVEISLSPVSPDAGGFVSVAIRDVSRLQSARDEMTNAHYNAHIAELGQQVIGARDLDEIIAAVPGVAARALGAHAAALFLLDGNDTELACRASHGIPAALIPALRGTTDPTTCLGFVLASGDTVAVDDYASETRFSPGIGYVGMDLSSALGAPIIGDRNRIGVLTAFFREQRAFSEDDKNFLRSVANIVGSAIKYLQAEERMRHAQQLEAVGQLTGGIAHDFNNLLTVIMGNLQIVQEDSAADTANAKPLEAALRAASSAADLTRKLLAFSRRQALRPCALDVNELVGGMLEMIKRTLGERITILAYPDPALLQAFADPAQLETALLNLVVNARDAMPKGGRLSIETAVRMLDAEYAEATAAPDTERYVMIAVSDNGMGMPAEVRRKAFDPYFTTKERGKGSGLGLSMVHGFAKQSRGHVAIYSEPGRGTTVRLYLPISGEAIRAVPTARTGAMPSGSETILMVEDDDAVRQVGARFLGQLGYRVHQAGDGETALQILDADTDIKLLFTDIVLPGRYAGPGLAQEARRRYPHLAVLFTSGYASGAIDGLDSLPGALIDKPYRREALALAVRTALDQSAQ